jgi:hypothetical protein
MILAKNRLHGVLKRHKVLGVPPHEGIIPDRVTGHVLDNLILAVTLGVVS